MSKNSIIVGPDGCPHERIWLRNGGRYGIDAQQYLCPILEDGNLGNPTDEFIDLESAGFQLLNRKRFDYWTETAKEEYALRPKPIQRKSLLAEVFRRFLNLFCIDNWSEKPFFVTNQDDGKRRKVTPTILRGGLIIYLSDGRMATLHGDVIAYVHDSEPDKDAN